VTPNTQQRTNLRRKVDSEAAEDGGPGAAQGGEQRAVAVHDLRLLEKEKHKACKATNVKRQKTYDEPIGRINVQHLLYRFGVEPRAAEIREILKRLDRLEHGETSSVLVAFLINAAVDDGAVLRDSTKSLCAGLDAPECLGHGLSGL
jgi:hypothetical protein